VSSRSHEDAHRAIESVARESYGRLVAFLCARTRDVAGAEDALGEALVAALATWPREGTPKNPEGWLLTAARRRLIDRLRHERVQAENAPTLKLVIGNDRDDDEESALGPVIPDERLKLLFVCAHPAIDPDMHTPLMLQAVLGLDAAAIARAFLVSPTTMGQRLVRAKTKIREAGIAFEVPEAHELAPRLDAVLNAIYAAYGSGWEDVAGADPRRRGLAEEAIWLGRLVVRLLPDEAEAAGLLALMLHCEARRPARRDASGAYVPLTRQDVARWSRPMIEEAERVLAAASRMNKPGRFQLEAAIQSVHAQRAVTGHTDWEAIALLYEGLVRIAQTIGALVAYAAALAEAKGAATALAALDAIPRDAITTYQPFWALRAHLLRDLGRTSQAQADYARAIGLSEDSSVRAFLTGETPP
jgi:predicted RNA polymerase sigma factor